MNDATERDYLEHVEMLANEAKRSLADGEHEDDHDAIHCAVDGSAWLIYTAYTVRLLQHTRNDDAVFEQLGPDALTGCHTASDAYLRIAYYALYADVAERYCEEN